MLMPSSTKYGTKFSVGKVMTSPVGFVHVGEEAQAFQWNSKPCCEQWRPNDSVGRAVEHEGTYVHLEPVDV